MTLIPDLGGRGSGPNPHAQDLRNLTWHHCVRVPSRAVLACGDRTGRHEVPRTVI